MHLVRFARRPALTYASSAAVKRSDPNSVLTSVPSSFDLWKHWASTFLSSDEGNTSPPKGGFQFGSASSLSSVPLPSFQKG